MYATDLTPGNDATLRRVDFVGSQSGKQVPATYPHARPGYYGLPKDCREISSQFAKRVSHGIPRPARDARLRFNGNRNSFGNFPRQESIGDTTRVMSPMPLGPKLACRSAPTCSWSGTVPIRWHRLPACVSFGLSPNRADLSGAGVPGSTNLGPALRGIRFWILDSTARDRTHNKYGIAATNLLKDE
jgi:hypothetical protein